MKMYSLSCKDLGVPTCNYVAMGESKEEVMEMAKNHAMKAHPKELKENMEKYTSNRYDTGGGGGKCSRRSLQICRM